MTETKLPARLTGLVFAVQPTTRGFAWVLFESATLPVAWSMVHASTGRNTHLVSRLARLLDRYEPAAFVIEAFEGRGTQRSPRIQQLCQSMVHEAESRGITKTIFEYDEVEMAFSRFGATSRSDVARVIAEHIEAFAHRLPRMRKLGHSEDARRSLFDAAALALTYFAYRGELE
jgi:Holliday junction resolvasome RuvABC endonuclease subunit